MICWGIWDTGRHSLQVVLCKDPSKSSQRISSLTSTSKHKIGIWRRHLLSRAWPLNGVRLQRQICMTWLLKSLTSTRSKCSCWSLTTKSGLEANSWSSSRICTTLYGRTNLKTWSTCRMENFKLTIVPQRAKCSPKIWTTIFIWILKSTLLFFSTKSKSSKNPYLSATVHLWKQN